MSDPLPAQSGAPRSHRIAVVGAGTAGMATAVFLHRAGHRVTLFERVATPGPVGAGLLLQPTGLRVLERLGLVDSIRKTGARIDRLYGTTANGRPVLDLRYADAGAGVHGIGIHRGALGSALWSAVQASGIMLRPGTSVDAIDQRADHVALRHSASPTPDEFDLAVIADGTFSQLRGRLDIGASVDVYPWGAWWTILADPQNQHGGVLRQVYRRADRMLGVMPVGLSPAAPASATPAPHVTLFWSVRRDAEAALRGRGLAAWKDEVLTLAPDCDELLAQVEDSSQLVFATYADVRMYPWHDRRVVVIGDAAHATSPQLGQGANLALVDAAVLARCVAANSSVEAALAAYSAARRAHLAYYQWASSMLTPMFQSDAALLPWVRDVAMDLTCKLPFLRAQMLRTLTGAKAGLLFGTMDDF